MWRLSRQKKELKRWLAVAAIIGATFFVFIFSVFRASRASTLAIQITRQPFCLDPARMYTYEEKLIDGAIYQSLLKYDPEKHLLEGELAERWSADKTGRIYTFVLRQGSRFHDGTPVTAQDVKYSWERVLDPKISSYGYLLKNVVGAGEKLSGSCQEVRGIEAVDDRTLRVTLKETDWTFPVVVSSPVLAIVKKQLSEKLGPQYGKSGTRVVGTGPFCLIKWRNEMILLRSNRFIPRSISSIVFLRFHVISDQREVRQLFEGGKLDVLSGVPAQFSLSETKSSRFSYTIFRKPVLSIYFLGFNLRKEPFNNNMELRKGIGLAIDKQQLNERLLGENGRVLTGLLPPELLSSLQDTGSEEQFSRDAALKSLDKAGFPYGLRLPPLIYAYNESTGNEMTARLIQEQLGQVGVDVNLKKIPWNRYLTEIMKNGDVHFFRLGWEADYPEAGNLLFNIFSSDQNDVNNYTGYSNQGFEQILRQARSEPDPTRREEFYRMANQMLASDMPVIPLFQRVSTFYLQKKIKGFNVDLLGRVDFSRILKE